MTEEFKPNVKEYTANLKKETSKDDFFTTIALGTAVFTSVYYVTAIAISMVYNSFAAGE